MGGEESVEMEVEGFKLQQVKSFKYLGVQIQNNWKQEAEIKKWIGTVMKIYYYTSNRSFFRMRAIIKKTKVNVYKAISYPILTYGCESWAKNVRSRIQAVEMNKRDYEKKQSKKRSGETRTESWPNIEENTKTTTQVVWAFDKDE